MSHVVKRRVEKASVYIYSRLLIVFPLDLPTCLFPSFLQLHTMSRLVLGPHQGDHREGHIGVACFKVLVSVWMSNFTYFKHHTLLLC